MSGLRYKAFISYSHQDEAWAAWLHRALESYHIPRRLIGKPGRSGDIPARINPVFRDREDLSAARDLSKRIVEALQNSESLIVVCSPESARSRWVNQEIREFQSMGRGNRIYCLIVDGDPQSEPADQCCFPPALFDKGGQQSFEPLAADARKWADGKRLAMLKLVAGILGIRLDELRQRDLHRRRRIRMAAGLAIVAVMTLAVVTVILQISRQHEREKAEQMATFIVDLGERLRSDTDLETLALISAQASRHFQNLDPEKLSPETGKKVALALRQMGRVTQLQGRPDEALEAFQRSRDLLSGLILKSPGLPELLLELSNAEYYIGNFYLELGAYEQARLAFQNSHQLTRELLDTDPENPDWIMERSYSHNNLAAVQLESGGGVDQATLTHLDEAIALIETAMQRVSDDMTYTSHYATTLAWAADAQYQACLLNNATSLRNKARRLAENLALHDPGNNDLKRRLAYAISGVAEIQTSTGKLDSAEQNLELAVSMLEQMSAADPSNMLYRREIVIGQFRLAKLVRGRSRLQEAQAMMAELDDKVRPGSEIWEQGEDSRQTYIDYLLTDADFEFLAGNVTAAEDRLQQALQLQLAELDPKSSGHPEQVNLQTTRFQWWEIHGNDGANVLTDSPETGYGAEGTFRSCDDAVIAAKLGVLRSDMESALQQVKYLRQRGYADPAFIRFCRKYNLCQE